MDINLSGKIALATGTSRGIGRAIAIALAQAGADVGGTIGRTNQPPTVLSSLSLNAAVGRWPLGRMFLRPTRSRQCSRPLLINSATSRFS